MDQLINSYLVACYSSKASKHPFLHDVINAESIHEAEQKVINKTYYFDSDHKKILAVCKKSEVIRQI
jgi:hypothetical protein